MDFYAEDAQHYQPTQIEPLRGRKAIHEDYEKLTIIPFPDAHLEKIRSFGQGDLICVELLFKGTHTGPLVGLEDEEIPPTNKSVQVPICFVNKNRTVATTYRFLPNFCLLSIKSIKKI